MPPLSVLDLSFTTTQAPGAAAIRRTVELARRCDELGYRRFWVAEHHNLPAVASGAPEIMIGAIAAATRRIRVGAGGVMLPNHAPLMVAERFKVLEALYPDRIDLGIGRAPGTDPLTSLALRRHQEMRGDDDFLDRFQELMLWKTRGWPASHRFSKITVMPEDVDVPPVWLLGSSDYSAALAGEVGQGFAFAHHFASLAAADAIAVYRHRFQPSQWLERPHAILATAAICADTDEAAERLAASADYNHIRRMRHVYGPLVSPEEALAVDHDPMERQAIQANRARLFVGSPARIRERLGGFAQAVGADEIMLTCPVFDAAAQRRSYELLAEAFGTTGA